MFTINKMLAGAVVLLGMMTGSAQATTYQINFDQTSTGVGTDWTGTFEADAATGVVTSFSALINGTLFDTLVFTAPSSFKAIYNATTKKIFGQGGMTAFTPNAPGATQSALLFGGSLSATRWSLGTCTSTLCGGKAVGTYTISASAVSVPDVRSMSMSVSPTAVPVPASLPLLGAALGMMGFLGWRKKQGA
jgi:hypothetical protein